MTSSSRRLHTWILDGMRIITTAESRGLGSLGTLSLILHDMVYVETQLSVAEPLSCMIPIQKKSLL